MKPTVDSIDSILAAAVEIDSDSQRREFLAQACGGDGELRQRLENLIDNHFRAGSFLEPPAQSPVMTVEERPVREGPGTVIGPYKLMEQIGEGGMGLVFVAEQQ